MDLIKVYGLIDNAGASLGIITNALLLFTIFKVSSGKLQSFSYLILASSVFDVFFCVIEVLTQHQLLVRRGVVFIMPHGIETILPPFSYYLFMTPHIFSCTHAVFILGPQYVFRYNLVTGNDATFLRLLKYVGVSSAAALFVGLSASVGIYQAKMRGDEFYLKQMDGPWFNSRAKEFFRYACDIRDIGTICFYGGAFVLTTVCFWVCAYYIWKTYRFMAESSAKLSERTKDLQRQFTWSLIVQTVNAIIFSIIPVSLICVSMLFRLDAEFVGMGDKYILGTMVPLSWLSTANALLTLYIVKAYRRYVVSLILCRCSIVVKPINSSAASKLQSTNIRSLEEPSERVVS
ncbi:hypothetical protein M3Y97_00639300 [Aphelenchoides bicaudatus]|nr:hypothetical protein M3Y97_00639300 [Aphelenchoides bicaudatus]